MKYNNLESTVKNILENNSEPIEEAKVGNVFDFLDIKPRTGKVWTDDECYVYVYAKDDFKDVPGQRNKGLWKMKKGEFMTSDTQSWQTESDCKKIIAKYKKGWVFSGSFGDSLPGNLFDYYIVKKTSTYTQSIAK